MGTSFYAAKAPADPENIRGWQLGTEAAEMTATSAVHLLTLLALPVTDYDLHGAVEPAELLQRIAVARVEGLSAAYERWGAWHRPGWFERQLDELTIVAAEAAAMGGEVCWA